MYESTKAPCAEFNVRKKYIAASAAICIFDGLDISRVGYGSSLYSLYRDRQTHCAGTLPTTAGHERREIQQKDAEREG